MGCLFVIVFFPFVVVLIKKNNNNSGSSRVDRESWWSASWYQYSQIVVVWFCQLKTYPITQNLLIYHHGTGPCCSLSRCWHLVIWCSMKNDCLPLLVVNLNASQCIFWHFHVFVEKELVTPPLDGVILPGVTRQSLLDLAREWVRNKNGKGEVSQLTFLCSLKQIAKPYL